jgi:hypothetical protein
MIKRRSEFLSVHIDLMPTGKLFWQRLLCCAACKNSKKSIAS